MSKSVFGIIIFFWISLHASQSVMDLADFMLLLTAFWFAYKSKEIPQLFQSFQPWPLWPVWLFVVLAGFLFGAPVETKIAAKLFWEFRWFLSFIAFIYLFRRIEWSEYQLRAFTLALFLIGIMDVVLFFVDYDKDPRAGGLFGHSMPFAHTIGPSALFLMFIGLKKAFSKDQPALWRAIYAVTPIIASALVVMSFTRGVWLGFAAALIVVAGILGRKFFVTAVLSLLIVATGLFLGSGRIQNRVMGKTIAESQSNNERVLYWKANLQIFRDFPIVGIGYSQNNVHVKEYLHKDGVDWLEGGHAHNQFVHFLAGTGILGLLCFVIFLTATFGKILKYLWLERNSKMKSDQYYLVVGCFAGMLCFAGGSLTESNFSIAKNRFMFLFIAAIAYAIATKTASAKLKK